mmetsp:Transcript_21906/g.65690  ORF Transcript_21906/g.65690 Transcript_21906/m.65690 type:complete len:113 (+) Transcript_21906:1062-1400(+)
MSALSNGAPAPNAPKQPTSSDPAVLAKILLPDSEVDELCRDWLRQSALSKRDEDARFWKNREPKPDDPPWVKGCGKTHEERMAMGGQATRTLDESLPPWNPNETGPAWRPKV